MSKETSAKKVDIVSIHMVKDRYVLYDLRYIKSPSDIVTLINDNLKLNMLDRECFVIIAVDAKSRPNCINIVSTGNLTSSIVHPREVFKIGILSNAHAIIAVHNHPSGDASPSKEDITITERIKKAGEILGIPLIDHVIVGECGSYKSLKEEGYL